MDRAFPIYEKWGIAGIKVDFMDRNDQYMVNFYERLLKKAAEHKLGVVLHGAHMPTGLDRTYPNFFSCEGVLGNEFSKRTNRITPEHCLNLPFTRMLGGQMDFTPGGFHHAPFGEFTPTGRDEAHPWVQGTRCFQLAMPVVYESAMTIFCDAPDSYRGQEGLDFYKVVPTTWDETKVIDGLPGEFIIVTRKNSGNWYLGAMNNDLERPIEIPLDFLGEGNYQATIYSDADDTDVNPSNTDSTTVSVNSKDVLKAKLAKRGGYAVHFKAN
jgi:alpha-glucosidase